MSPNQKEAFIPNLVSVRAESFGNPDAGNLELDVFCF